MNTFSLAMRLAENLTVGDWSALPLPEAEKLREAIQTGINELVTYLPPHRLTAPYSDTLRAPVTQDISIIGGAKTFAYVAGGNAYPLGGYATEASALGLLAVVTGDSVVNRLILPGELLRAHAGAGGTVPMTLYGDSLRMGPSVWHITSAVRCIGNGHAVTLSDPPQGWERPFHLETGMPRYWWTEPLAGASRAAAPLYLLRVWPVPNFFAVLEMHISAFPQSVSFLDLHDEARPLPVTAEEEPLLISLCEAALLKHPLWRKDVSKSEVRTSADRARNLLNSRNRPMSNRPNRVGTRPGW